MYLVILSELFILKVFDTLNLTFGHAAAAAGGRSNPEQTREISEVSHVCSAIV